ncbi:hypothetical protein Angca_002474, partial [Angiostrongylus cantonensis]
RVIHRIYSSPGRIFSNRVIDRLFQSLYWALRTIQFKIFYKNEELDQSDLHDGWEVGIQPPSLDELATTTHFNRTWLKYMYARFKNVCPSGRMREKEFQQVLASIIASERANDQYISRVFLAFSNGDKSIVTFKEFLSFTQAVFGFESEESEQENINKETVHHRASTVFNELDSNGDGFVTTDDMIRLFK